LQGNHLTANIIFSLFLSSAVSTQAFAQSAQPVPADLQTTVQSFLQAWYVDRKSPNELKSYIAKDNGFSLLPLTSANRPATEARADPVQQLFRGAFTPVPIGAEISAPKSLRDAIEYPPAKRPVTERAVTQQPPCLTSETFAICKPDQLPKGSVLPTEKPAGKDPIATYLWHLATTYQGNLYIVLYTTTGAGLLKETAILYWIPEGGTWKLAAFMGTDW
jgi:hypothetical protein